MINQSAGVSLNRKKRNYSFLYKQLFLQQYEVVRNYRGGCTSDPGGETLFFQHLCSHLSWFHFFLHSTYERVRDNVIHTCAFFFTLIYVTLLFDDDFLEAPLYVNKHLTSCFLQLHFNS